MSQPLVEYSFSSAGTIVDFLEEADVSFNSLTGFFYHYIILSLNMYLNDRLS